MHIFKVNQAIAHNIPNVSHLFIRHNKRVTFSCKFKHTYIYHLNWLGGTQNIKKTRRYKESIQKLVDFFFVIYGSNSYNN